MKIKFSTLYTGLLPPSFRKGFSLVELLVSMAILSIMLAAAGTMISRTQKTWTATWSRTTQFRDARLAFELVTRNLSQSTLNTYWDYVNDRNGDPIDYQRRSELHFYTTQTKERLPENPSTTHCIFFQAILGYSKDSSYQQLSTLLNSRGYYIDFGKDDFQRPRFLSAMENQPEPIWRYRLMEYLPPSEKNLVYHADLENRENGTPIQEWFSPELIAEHSRPVVDNVVALIISPQKSPDEDNDSDEVYGIAPNFKYDPRDLSRPDSYNVLPPLVSVTLVVLSGPSASRLQDIHGENPPDLLESDWFQQANEYESDLAELEQKFQDENLQYRVFTTTVAIRSAKWSH
jgi:uncharacterized protein (TIGR02599 family)